MLAPHASILITDRSRIGEARRLVNHLTEEAGWSEANRGRAAIVVSELATNLSIHAVSGELLLHTEDCEGRKWLDIQAIDSGPGMPDLSKCMTDGYSTAGTPGNGLGAVQRIASVLDVYTQVPNGTVLYARVDEIASTSRPASGFAWGVINRPIKGETACGDVWSIATRPDAIAVLVADGLGHGADAHAAALEARNAFEKDPFAPLTTIVETAHAKMRGTRGGAVAAAQIDRKAQQLKYVGVGNISGSLRSQSGSKGRGLFTHNGTVGVQLRKVQEFEYECPADALLIMHSDGIQTRWALESYAGLALRHPAIIAGILYRDFNRGRDDVTVAVIQLHS